MCIRDRSSVRPAATTGSSTRTPAASRASSSASVGGSDPTPTYAATTRASRTSGAAIATAASEAPAAARAARTPAARAAAGASLAAVAMAAPEVRDARVVAAYVGVGSEPPTLALLDALLAAGVRVLLPVVAAGRTLDWSGYSGAAELVPVAAGGGLSLREPAGTRLGSAALGAAAAVPVSYTHLRAHETVLDLVCR